MSWFGPIGDWIEDKTTDVLHKITGTPTAAEKRAATNMVNDQVNAYKQQTEITRQELAAKAGEVASEKRRVGEKQVRALRNRYRASSFLGAQDSSQPDMNSKLGG